MEIEMKPIALEQRLLYVKRISEKPETAPSGFPWGMLVLAAVVGLGIGAAIVQYKWNREAKMSFHSPDY